MAIPELVAGLSVTLCAVFIVTRLLNRSSNAGRHPLPPGPKGLPLVGNLNDMPKPDVVEAIHWSKHKELYGPISSVTVLNQTLVIVNDAQIALELLEKRSLKHYSRPNPVFGCQIVGWGNSLGFSQPGNLFRAQRKAMSRIIGSTTATSQFDQLQETEAGHLLMNVLDDPDNLLQHIKREAGAVIMKIAYGYNVAPSDNDVLVDAVNEAMHEFGIAGSPGAFMVDIIPLLRYVPEWFPGTGWKQTAKLWAQHLRDVTEKPYAFAKRQISEGKDNYSLVSQLIGGRKMTPEEEINTKWTALSLYAGGSDTTVSSIASFFLVMTIYPEVQRKAQEEIDRVVGKDRLPNFADRPNLPYVEAVVKEILRWHPVGPMAIPHASSEDDVIEGYLIPKDAVILPNVWVFLHDPEMYSRPNEFRPERFLATEGHEPEPDPQRVAFGFGRRVCPGKNLAENALYITIAQSLAVFDISKRVVDGVEVEPHVKFTPGIVSHPEPFENSIKPRSAHHEKLIRALEKIYPWEESSEELLKSVTY